MKHHLLIFFLTILFFLLLAGCNDNSNQLPNEKAERYAQQAEEALRRQNYEEAERLLIDCITIHTETNNETKLIENYSALATAQVLSGKLSLATGSLIALRGYYRQSVDRTAELQTMLQLGNIYFQLGKTKEAISILTEAFNSGQLYQRYSIRAAAAKEIASIYASTGRAETSLPFFINAAEFYREKNDVARLLETEGLHISALVANGNSDEAFEIYRRNELFLRSNPASIHVVSFFLRCGEAFAAAGESAFAKACFEFGLRSNGNSASNQQSEVQERLLIGLGELYFNNFAFADAMNNFTKAYELAKAEHGSHNGIVLGYLLIRIGDCLLKDAAYGMTGSTDGIIRGTQVYEQAQTNFARSGLGIGEAIALQRLGMTKQLLRDDNAAITFYKRGFDKFLLNATPLAFYSLPVDIRRLCSSISQTNSIEAWFTDDLISLLLKYRKFAEALSCYETVRNMRLQSDLARMQLQFREPAKHKRYTELQQTIARKISLQMELFHLTMLQKPNKNHASKVLQDLSYTQSKAASEAITITQEFPAFSFLNGVQKSSVASLIEAIPSASTILEYCFAGNELWVFILRNNEEIAAIKVSTFGYTMKNRMLRFMEALGRPANQRGFLQSEAEQLYSLLVQPVESYGKQSFIIIPPIGLEKFPFHILPKNDRSLLDMMDVSYLPGISFIYSQRPNLSSLQNSSVIAAFGFTADSRWGLEFELRDIRSFFKNTAVNVNLSATPEKLLTARGEVLQISSPFQKNKDGDYSFLLSSGSTLKSGSTIPIEKFASFYPFPIVYLSDVQLTTNNISIFHPALWMLNGSTTVIATQFPITSNSSKTFSEYFYSSLSSEATPAGSYKNGVRSLERKKDQYGNFAGASYFYYGVK